MSKDLLLEIGTEEIPAKFMPGILNQLKKIAKDKFDENRIVFKNINTFGTPRRMVLIVEGVDEFQPDVKVESKGPSIKIAYDLEGRPTKAAMGFARGQGVDVNELVEKDGYVYAVKELQGLNVKELLPAVLSSIIHSLSFPKNMRWGTLDIKFVRPIRWIVALFGDETIEFSLAKVKSGNVTRGHRFLGQHEFSVNNAHDYLEKLAKNYVMVNQNERRQNIKAQVEELARIHGGHAEITEDLLEEVTYLVEYPTALCGRFDREFLNLPKEAVITPMREHQRYFPVLDDNKKLLPVFITVRNGGKEHLDTVTHGNERVLKARLSDAQFFFAEDKKLKLAQRVDMLKNIVFQEGLGTLYDKSIRLLNLAEFIVSELGMQGEKPTIKRAAYLSKTDLTTNMVCEFTELQGIMGREYAIIDGEGESVADAIFEHYLPRFAGDILPQSTSGRIISIADKIDNVVATFSRGLIPTGSQDPYALRRQANGIVNIIIDAKYHFSFYRVVSKAMELLNYNDEQRQRELFNAVKEFFDLRLKNVLSESNIRYDMIDAVLATDTDDIYDTWLRAHALAQEAHSDVMQKAVQAFNRAGNLAKNAVHGNVDAALFEVIAERQLYESYINAKADIEKLVAQRKYNDVFKIMATMTEPLDNFFNAVMVMVDNESVKNNRLALLKAVTELVLSVADLSKLVS